MAQQPGSSIEKVEGVMEKRSSASFDYENFEPETRLAPNRDHFENLMSPAENESVRKVQTAQGSIVEEVSSVGQMAERAKGSPQQLAEQARDVIAKIDELKQKLNTPNLELKSSMQQELRNKLSHIDDSLRVAMSRTGLEYTPPVAPEKSQGTINRFLGLLTDSQDKLMHLTDDIERINASGKPFSPATMIVLQMKVGIMQQEIEFFTTVVNKSLESTKTIMNVQV